VAGRVPIDFAVTYDTSKVRRLAHPVFTYALAGSLKDVALSLWAYIGQEAPTRHGRLAGSWRARQAGPLTWTLGSPVLYRWYVNDGTKPHIIRPRRAKVLAFQMATATRLGDRRAQFTSKKTGKLVVDPGRGTMTFARVVHHPGTKANPYVDRAIARVKTEIPRIVEGAIERATDGTA
jgi:hypothetical protein